MLRTNTDPKRSAWLFSILVLLVVVPSAGFAQTETVLHAFSGTDGANPKFANLLIDTKGNLYGTTPSGGAHGYGAVYRIPAGGGENLLYSFTGKSDGGYPQGGVVYSHGALYGTTQYGGSTSGECKSGCGTVFKITGYGKESVVHAFAGPSGDGALPYGDLVTDAAGNLYGTTSYGGNLNVGAIFEVTASGWESILYSFANPPDGAFPTGQLVRDSAGNIYGTTNSGGASCVLQGCGTVFELASTGESVLHEFGNSTNDGNFPWAGLVGDSKGNLYGTASGGQYFSGIVFKLSRSTGAWKETILYQFTGLADGASPNGGLLLDSSGNLYGTTTGGGAFNAGTVFRISPTGQESVLYSFTGGTDGQGPVGSLVADKQGNLYGTTSAGGNMNSKCTGGFGPGCGVVFKLTP